MNTSVFILLVITAAIYLIGSVPFSYLIARAKGIDLRTVGSGNIGATNVARSIGFGYGIGALALDLLKGVGAAVVVGLTQTPVYLSAFAVVGHNWSLFLGFKAGKGVATTLGILLVLHWPAFLITIGIWGLIALITRYVSLSSMGALLSAPVTLLLMGVSGDGVILMAGLGLLSVFQHRDNFQKLLGGTENRLG